MKPIFVLSLCAALAAAAAGCGRTAHENTADAAGGSPDVITTLTVHAQKVSNRLDLAAHAEANPTSVVHVYPPLSGRVLELKVLPGQEVRRDQIIGMLQSTELEQAQSDYEKARIEAARADLQLNRAKDLLQHEVMAQRDYDDLAALDKADHAEVDRAGETLRILGYAPDSPQSKAGMVAIRSPRAGVVLDVNTATGELQRSLDNATPIATIADIDPIWIVADLYPRDVSQVRAGQPAEVTVSGYPGIVYHARIDNVSDAVDPVTLTLKVRVVLPNPAHRIKPQMYATVSITSQRADAMLVPATAVIRDGVTDYVFLANGAGKYIRRNVQLGQTHDGSVEIVAGLKDGDTIAATGTELLRGAGDE
jgi:cobalt-zinc-cadmium efflux system membrane fusion protein